MSATACRLGLHHWRRLWGEAGPYRECRDCGTTATGGKVAWQITGRTLVLTAMVIAAGVAALVLAILADAVFDHGPPANYKLDATVKCLRKAGYTIAPNGRRGIFVKQKGYADLGVHFAPNAAVAHRDATEGSVPAPTKRNVDIDQEGGDFPSFLTACLRTG